MNKRELLHKFELYKSASERASERTAVLKSLKPLSSGSYGYLQDLAGNNRKLRSFANEANWEASRKNIGAGLLGSGIGAVAAGSVNPFLLPAGLLAGPLVSAVATPFLAAEQARNYNEKRWDSMNFIQKLIDRIKYKEYNKLFSKEAAQPAPKTPIKNVNGINTLPAPEGLEVQPTNLTRKNYPADRVEDQFGRKVIPTSVDPPSAESHLINRTLGKSVAPPTRSQVGKFAPAQFLHYKDPSKEIADAKAYYEKEIEPNTRTFKEHAAAAAALEADLANSDAIPANRREAIHEVHFPNDVYPRMDYSLYTQPIDLYQGPNVHGGHQKPELNAPKIFPWGRPGVWEGYTTNGLLSAPTLESLSANNGHALKMNKMAPNTAKVTKDQAFEYFRRNVTPHEMGHAATSPADPYFYASPYPINRSNLAFPDERQRRIAAHGMSAAEQVQWLKEQQHQRALHGMGRAKTYNQARAWLEEAVGNAGEESFPTESRRALFGNPIGADKGNDETRKIYEAYPWKNSDPLRGIRWLKHYKQEATPEDYEKRLEWLSRMMPALAKRDSARFGGNVSVG